MEKYINLVKQHFPIEGKSYYNATAFLHKNGKEVVLTGLVVDNKYFIDTTTNEIYQTSDFHLINNLDETED